MMKSLIALVLLAAAAHAAKPNILFILADDLGYGDLSCYGQKHFETPAIDSLAANGLRFTDHYSGSTVCAPSRATLMTGKDTGHAAIRGNGAFALPASETSVASLLRKAGYRTAKIGKSCVTGNTQTPEDAAVHGFDWFFGTTDHRDGHFRYPRFVYENTTRIDLPGNDLHTGDTYDLDLYRDKALAFLGQQSAEKPFFLLLSLPVPHAAINVPEDSMARVRPGVRPERKVPAPQKPPHYTHVAEPKASYAGLMTRIDDAVAAITAKLREQGLLENTLIIFTSDNGPHAEGGYHPRMLQSSGALRGHKRDLYEGGIRVPMIAHWPAAIRPGRATDHPSAFWDFLPTACDLAGIPIPDDIQGISYLPVLRGVGEQPTHDYLYWEFFEQGGRRALRAGDWKIVQYNLAATPRGALQLFNLRDDVAESTDLAAKHPDILEKLRKQMDAARTPSPLFPYPALDSAP